MLAAGFGLADGPPNVNFGGRFDAPQTTAHQQYILDRAAKGRRLNQKSEEIDYRPAVDRPREWDAKNRLVCTHFWHTESGCAYGDECPKSHDDPVRRGPDPVPLKERSKDSRNAARRHEKARIVPRVLPSEKDLLKSQNYSPRPSPIPSSSLAPSPAVAPAPKQPSSHRHAAPPRAHPSAQGHSGVLPPPGPSGPGRPQDSLFPPPQLSSVSAKPQLPLHLNHTRHQKASVPHYPSLPGTLPDQRRKTSPVNTQPEGQPHTRSYAKTQKPRTAWQQQKQPNNQNSMHVPQAHVVHNRHQPLHARPSQHTHQPTQNRSKQHPSLPLYQPPSNTHQESRSWHPEPSVASRERQSVQNPLSNQTSSRQRFPTSETTNIRQPSSVSNHSQQQRPSIRAQHSQHSTQRRLPHDIISRGATQAKVTRALPAQERRPHVVNQHQSRPSSASKASAPPKTSPLPAWPRVSTAAAPTSRLTPKQQPNSKSKSKSKVGGAQRGSGAKQTTKSHAAQRPGVPCYDMCVCVYFSFSCEK